MAENSITSGILDSGTRREFETGAKRDITEGKGRFDLMPLDVVADIMSLDAAATPDVAAPDDVVDAISMAVAEGRYDYWHFIIACEKYIQVRIWSVPEAMLEVARHFEAGAKKYGEHNWEKGIPISSYVDSACRHLFKWLAGQTDERHDRAVLWNLMCAAWTVKHGGTDLTNAGGNQV